jgi:hypothetical protein
MDFDEFSAMMTTIEKAKPGIKKSYVAEYEKKLSELQKFKDDFQRIFGSDITAEINDKPNAPKTPRQKVTITEEQIKNFITTVEANPGSTLDDLKKATQLKGQTIKKIQDTYSRLEIKNFDNLKASLNVA